MYMNRLTCAGKIDRSVPGCEPQVTSWLTHAAGNFPSSLFPPFSPSLPSVSPFIHQGKIR